MSRWSRNLFLAWKHTCNCYGYMAYLTILGIFLAGPCSNLQKLLQHPPWQGEPALAGWQPVAAAVVAKQPPDTWLIHQHTFPKFMLHCKGWSLVPSNISKYLITHHSGPPHPGFPWFFIHSSEDSENSTQAARFTFSSNTSLLSASPRVVIVNSSGGLKALRWSKAALVIVIQTSTSNLAAYYHSLTTTLEYW